MQEFDCARCSESFIVFALFFVHSASSSQKCGPLLLSGVTLAPVNVHSMPSSTTIASLTRLVQKLRECRLYELQELQEYHKVDGPEVA